VELQEKQEKKNNHLGAEVEKEQEEDFPSPPIAIEIGRAGEKIGTSSSVFTSDDVSKSPADPEDVYTSQFLEANIEASSLSLGDKGADVPSNLNTPGINLARPSAQT